MIPSLPYQGIVRRALNPTATQPSYDREIDVSAVMMEPRMKLVFISDTHNQHDKLTVPDGDVLIHCGDHSMRGTIQETQKFAAWLSEQPHREILVVPGNHDGACEKWPLQARQTIETSRKNVRLLIDESCEINGVKFYGSPWTPRYGWWAYMDSRGEKMRLHWKQIPDDVKVLITHGPPHGILDLVPGDGIFDEQSAGCEELRKRVAEFKQLKVHAFGHLHRQGGQVREHEGVQFINAAMLDDLNKNPRQPMVVEVE